MMQLLEGFAIGSAMWFLGGFVIVLSLIFIDHILACFETIAKRLGL